MTIFKLSDLGSFSLPAESLAKTAFLLILALILRIVVCKFISIFFDKFRKIGTRAHTNKLLMQRVNTLETLAKNAAILGIYGMILISILATWGVSIVPLMTGAGIVGLAVAIGSQKLVNDVVTGFFILLENQYNVGDKITVAGIEGIVKAINLRVTVLEEETGKIHYIPNSSISIVSKHLEYEQKKPS